MATARDPQVAHGHLTGNVSLPPPPGASHLTTEEQVRRLLERFAHFQQVYAAAREQQDWELATNARGSMTLVGRALRRLGADIPPGPGANDLL